MTRTASWTVRRSTSTAPTRSTTTQTAMVFSTVRKSISTGPVPSPGTPMAMGSATRDSSGATDGDAGRDARASSTDLALRAIGPVGSHRLRAGRMLRQLSIHGGGHEPEPRHPQPIDLLDSQALIASGHLIADLSRPAQTGEDVAAEGFDVDPLGGQVQVVAIAQLDERDESVKYQAAIGRRALRISWVAFVLNLSHERLDQVFETDDPRRPPVLIHHHRELDPFVAHPLQHVRCRHRLGHDDERPQVVGEVEGRRDLASKDALG